MSSEKISSKHLEESKIRKISLWQHLLSRFLAKKIEQFYQEKLRKKSVAHNRLYAVTSATYV